MAYALGFCCRTGTAAAVAVAPGGGFARRWAVDLSAPGTPVQLFHAAAGLPAAEVERFEMTPHPVEFDMYYSV